MDGGRVDLMTRFAISLNYINDLRLFYFILVFQDGYFPKDFVKEDKFYDG